MKLHEFGYARHLASLGVGYRSMFVKEEAPVLVQPVPQRATLRIEGAPEVGIVPSREGLIPAVDDELTSMNLRRQMAESDFKVVRVLPQAGVDCVKHLTSKRGGDLQDRPLHLVKGDADPHDEGLRQALGDSGEKPSASRILGHPNCGFCALRLTCHLGSGVMKSVGLDDAQHVVLVYRKSTPQHERTSVSVQEKANSRRARFARDRKPGSPAARA